MLKPPPSPSLILGLSIKMLSDFLLAYWKSARMLRDWQLSNVWPKRSFWEMFWRVTEWGTQRLPPFVSFSTRTFYTLSLDFFSREFIKKKKNGERKNQGKRGSPLFWDAWRAHDAFSFHFNADLLRICVFERTTLLFLYTRSTIYFIFHFCW